MKKKLLSVLLALSMSVSLLSTPALAAASETEAAVTAEAEAEPAPDSQIEGAAEPSLDPGNETAAEQPETEPTAEASAEPGEEETEVEVMEDTYELDPSILGEMGASDQNLLPMMAAPPSGGVYNLSAGELLINQSNASQYQTITGSFYGIQSSAYSEGNGVVTIDGVTTTLLLQDVSISSSSTNYSLVGISLKNGANVTLRLSGTNTLSGSCAGAAIHVPDGCTLTIENGDPSGVGRLTANGGNWLGGGAGIGANGPGITSYHGGTEGGYPESCGTIEIRSGEVIANGGSYKHGATFYTGAAGIGGSASNTSGVGSDTGKIIISGGSVTAQGGYMAAGIGSGGTSTFGEITISGGTVAAVGGRSSAGIGGGYGSAINSIRITGGQITATPKDGGAAIGAGCIAELSEQDKIGFGTINITGGDITANGNIGFGRATFKDYDHSSLSIDPNAKIHLNGGTLDPMVGHNCRFDVRIYDGRLEDGTYDIECTVAGRTYPAQMSVKGYAASVSLAGVFSLAGLSSSETMRLRLPSKDLSWMGSAAAGADDTYSLTIGQPLKKVVLYFFDSQLCQGDAVNVKSLRVKQGQNTLTEGTDYLYDTNATCDIAPRAAMSVWLPEGRDITIDASLEKINSGNAILKSNLTIKAGDAITMYRDPRLTVVPDQFDLSKGDITFEMVDGKLQATYYSDTGGIAQIATDLSFADSYRIVTNQEGTSHRVILQDLPQDQELDLIFDNVKLKYESRMYSGYSASFVQVLGGSRLHLEVIGKNELDLNGKHNGGTSCIFVPYGSELRLDGSGTMEISGYGGWDSAIGGIRQQSQYNNMDGVPNGKITIAGAELKLTSTQTGGTGIGALVYNSGSYTFGDITITGGTITGSCNDKVGAMIGYGYFGTNTVKYGTITISGGTINGTITDGAGIGCGTSYDNGEVSIRISGGILNLKGPSTERYYSPFIGARRNSSNISISGGEISLQCSSNSGYSLLGGGIESDEVKSELTVNGGTLKIEGNGRYGSSTLDSYWRGNISIKIEGGTVVAYQNSSSQEPVFGGCKNITVTGGSISTVDYKLISEPTASGSARPAFLHNSPKDADGHTVTGVALDLSETVGSNQTVPEGTLKHYGLKDVTTDADGKIYAFLADDRYAVSIGGESEVPELIYGQYNNRLPLQAKLKDYYGRNREISTNGISYSWKLRKQGEETGESTDLGASCKLRNGLAAGQYEITVAVIKDSNEVAVSEPVTIEIEPAEASPDLPDDLKGDVGAALRTVTLPNGFEWLNPNQEISSEGWADYQAVYHPSDSDSNHRDTIVSIRVKGEIVLRVTGADGTEKLVNTMARALEEAKKLTNPTIELKKNITTSEPLSYKGSLTLNLNRCTWTYEGPDGSNMLSFEGDLTMKNADESNRTGTITAGQNADGEQITTAILFEGSGKLTIEGGRYEVPIKAPGGDSDPADLTLSGGRFVSLTTGRDGHPGELSSGGALKVKEGDGWTDYAIRSYDEGRRWINERSDHIEHVEIVKSSIQLSAARPYGENEGQMNQSFIYGSVLYKKASVYIVVEQNSFAYYAIRDAVSVKLYEVTDDGETLVKEQTVKFNPFTIRDVIEIPKEKLTITHENEGKHTFYVTVSTMSPTDVTSRDDSGQILRSAEMTYTVQPRTLTPVLELSGKTWDGTTAVVESQKPKIVFKNEDEWWYQPEKALLQGDQVKAEAEQYVYDDSDAGRHTVKATGIKITGGEKADYYTLESTEATTEADIAAVELTEENCTVKIDQVTNPADRSRDGKVAYGTPLHATLTTNGVTLDDHDTVTITWLLSDVLEESRMTLYDGDDRTNYHYGENHTTQARDIGSNIRAHVEIEGNHTGSFESDPVMIGKRMVSLTWENATGLVYGDGQAPKPVVGNVLDQDQDWLRVDPGYSEGQVFDAGTNSITPKLLPEGDDGTNSRYELPTDSKLEFEVAKAKPTFDPKTAETSIATITDKRATTLKDIDLSKFPGLRWKDASTEVTYGTHRYDAIYNPDEKNYEDLELAVTVIGLDVTDPVITGIRQGGIYYGDHSFKVADEGRVTVMLDGEELFQTDGTYHILADNKQHQVVIRDESEHTVTMDVTVYQIYTVTYFADGVQIGGPQRVGYGQDAKPELVPEKEDYAGAWDQDGKNIQKDTKILAKYTLILVDYTIIDGANQLVIKTQRQDAGFRSDAAYRRFVRVEVDGAVLDASHYTVAEGSTIVELKPSYLKTMSPGAHTLAIVSNNGRAETHFNVHEDENAPKISFRDQTMEEKGDSEDGILIGDTTVWVEDDHLKQVKLDGKEVTLSEDGSFTIPVDGQEHEIWAVDLGGEETSCHVTVKHGALVVVGDDASETEVKNPAKAFEEAKKWEHPTIRLMEDVSTSEMLSYRGKMTLDLNGFKWMYLGGEEASMLAFNGDLTLGDSSEGGKGSIRTADPKAEAAILFEGSGQLNITGGTYEVPIKAPGTDEKPADVTLSGGQFAELQSGNDKQTDTVIADGYAMRDASTKKWITDPTDRSRYEDAEVVPTALKLEQTALSAAAVTYGDTAELTVNYKKLNQDLYTVGETVRMRLYESSDEGERIVVEAESTSEEDQITIPVSVLTPNAKGAPHRFRLELSQIAGSEKAEAYRQVVNDKAFTVDVSKKTLTPALTVEGDKVWNGRTTLDPKQKAALTLSGIVGQDEVAAAAKDYQYDVSEVGTHKVKASGLTLTGAKKDYYRLSAAEAETEANIFAATLSAGSSLAIDPIENAADQSRDGSAAYGAHLHATMKADEVKVGNGDSRTIEWIRISEDGSEQVIAGANDETYTTQAEDIGKKLKSRVTISGHHIGTLQSEALAVGPRTVSLSWENQKGLVYLDGKTPKPVIGNLLVGDEAKLSAVIDGYDAAHQFSAGEHTVIAKLAAGEGAEALLGYYELPKDATLTFHVAAAEPEPEEPKEEDPKPEDPKPEDPKPEEPKEEEPKDKPADKPAEDPKAEDPKVEDPKDKPTEEPQTEDPKDKPTDKPAEDPKEEEPKDKPAEKPAEDPKVEEPKDKPAEKPAEDPKVEEPKDKPAEKPAEDPKVEEPKDKPAEKPAEEPKVEEPKDKPAEEPQDKPSDQPAEDPKTEEPKDQPTEKPSEDPKVEEPKDQPADKPAEDPKVEDPKDKPAEKPSEDPKKEDPKKENPKKETPKKKSSNTRQAKTTTTASKKSEKARSTQPKTGDSNASLFWTMLAIASGVVAGILARRRRKRS